MKACLHFFNGSHTRSETRENEWTTALPDEENDAGTGLDLVCRAPWKQSCPVEYYHLSEREMIVSRCGIPKTTKTETIPRRPCHYDVDGNEREKRSWLNMHVHEITMFTFLILSLSPLSLLLLLLLSLSLLSLPLFFLYLISCSLKHIRGVGFVFAGFDADHSTRSKTNDSDRNDVKTAGKGGKLQSCQQLLFECGYRWSFEYFFEWKSLVVALGHNHGRGHLLYLSVGQESWLWNSVTWWVSLTQSRDACCQVTWMHGCWVVKLDHSLSVP